MTITTQIKASQVFQPNWTCLPHDSVEMRPEAGVFESQEERADATDITDSMDSPSATQRKACKTSKICLYASSGRPRYALTPTLGINFALRV